MSQDDPTFGSRPEIDAAWNFPLFDALTGRRSRRFGFGMEMEQGPYVYSSDKEPIPLSEEETAMLVIAASGATGSILADSAVPGGMVKSVGRSHPSAIGTHCTELFFTNDDGVYVYRGTQQKMNKFREYETLEDRDKVIRFYEENTVKLADGRLDLPQATPGLWAHNLWVTNRPGTTLFMPVTDASEALIKLLINLCDAKGGRYSTDGGCFIVDELKGMQPAGCERWADDGLLDRNKIMPLARLERLIASTLTADGAMMGMSLQLALAAMGLGGWTHSGFTPLIVMGGTSTCQGLGFRFVMGKEDPVSNPVGVDGIFEAYCPPYYADMDAAVDAVVAKMGENLDSWEARGMVLPHKTNNEDFAQSMPGISDEGIQCVKDICRYIYDTYGKFPGTLDTMNLMFFTQAHHLDCDFYDAHFKDGAYLDTHRDHFNTWHPGTNVAKRDGAE